MGKTALIVVIVLILGGAGYFFYRSQYMTPTSPATSSNAVVPKNTVIIQSNSFTPGTLNVKVGDKVTWTNNDSYAHTVVSDTGDFDSGNMSSGQSFGFTFTKAGTFNYHCGVHTFMTAQVVVTN